MKDKNGNVLDYKVIERWKNYYEKMGIKLNRKVFEYINMPDCSIDGNIAILIPAGLDFEKIKKSYDLKYGYKVNANWSGWSFNDDKRPESDYLLIMKRLLTSPLQLDKDHVKGINFYEGFLFISEMVMRQKLLEKPSVICCGSDHSNLAVNFLNRIHPMISVTWNGLQMESVKKIYNHHQYMDEELYEKYDEIKIYDHSHAGLSSTTPKVVGIYS